MNNQKSSMMPYVIIAIIVAIGLAAYFYWNGNSTPVNNNLQDTADSTEVVGSQVFQLLGKINAIKIDSAFFKGQTFSTLVDYSVSIPALPIGRSNPFAPIGGTANLTQSTTTLVKSIKR